MRVWISLAILSFATFAVSGQVRYPAIRTELLVMEKVDQDGRMKCTNSPADEQIKCLADISKAVDEPNTKRLAELFDQIGFPDSPKVGKDGMRAYMILLQHVTDDDLRVKSEKPITESFRKKELTPMDYANFIDRLRLHREKKQLYGSGFEFKDGKMVLSPTEDMRNLDKRRTRIGLPPLTEHVKMMKETYHLEVVIPSN